VIDVTTATRSQEKDHEHKYNRSRENAGYKRSAGEGQARASQETEVREKGGPGQEGRRHEGGPQQEGRSDRDVEAGERSDAGRDHGCYGVSPSPVRTARSNSSGLFHILRNSEAALAQIRSRSS